MPRATFKGALNRTSPKTRFEIPAINVYLLLAPRDTSEDTKSGGPDLVSLGGIVTFQAL